MDPVVAAAPNFCGACLGLHMLPNHTIETCPLLKAAKDRCDCEAGPCPWEAPVCDRRLFSLLVSLQLFDGLVSHQISPEDLSVGRLVDRLGLAHRIWSSQVPVHAFQEHVKLEEDDSNQKSDVIVTRVLPRPARWSPQTPLALELDLWSVESVSMSVRELPRPFETVLSVKFAVVASCWKAFLLDVISGSTKWLSQGQLMPVDFRQLQQDLLVTVPGGNFSKWSPVLLNSKRGFLMRKVKMAEKKKKRKEKNEWLFDLCFA